MINRNHFLVITLATSMIGLAGCSTASKHGRSLVFAQSHTVGISVAASSANNTPEFTVGYRDYNFAIVPVTAKQQDGDQTSLTSHVIEGPDGQQCNSQNKAGCAHDTTDSYSVLGQFSANSNAVSTEVGLTKFFATGIAAKTLADGFKKRMSTQTSSEEGSETAAGEESDDNQPGPQSLRARGGR